MSDIGEVRAVAPLARPPDAEVVVPGSKSLTNRALVLAALAEGTSVIEDALVADDTDAMVGALRDLGVAVRSSGGGRRLEVDGTGGRIPAGPATVHVRLSGTTSRFLLPVLALGPGPYRIDGAPPMRRRAMGPVIDALRELGAGITEPGEAGHLPLDVGGGHLRGGTVTVPADLSSQFVSALLLVGPMLDGGLDLGLTGSMVSRPYLDLTVAAMAAFGAAVDHPDPRRYRVAPGGYRATRYRVEPDASAASYFWAAAAMTGGRVRVVGLDRDSLQGDVAVVDVLARMGAEVRSGPGWIEVRGTGRLTGIDVDLGDLPDMAQTVAVVAAVADGRTRVRGVGIIRDHETDRIAGVRDELRRCGVGVTEHDDGWTITPAALRPARVLTYDDHRMAMSFALLGLVAPGIEIVEPGVVTKTFPGFFTVLDSLRTPPGASR